MSYLICDPAVPDVSISAVHSLYLSIFIDFKTMQTISIVSTLPVNILAAITGARLGLMYATVPLTLLITCLTKAKDSEFSRKSDSNDVRLTSNAPSSVLIRSGQTM